MARMDAMIFKKIELKNATIEETVSVLIQESKNSDPEQQGISFVLHTQPAYPQSKITLSEENASLRDVLKQIQQQSSYVYGVGEGAIYLGYDNGEGLTRRTFTVPDGFFKIKPEASPQSFADVKPQLAAQGIHFPVGMSAQYQPGQRQLIVTASPDQLEDIDDLLFRFSQQHAKGP